MYFEFLVGVCVLCVFVVLFLLLYFSFGIVEVREARAFVCAHLCVFAVCLCLYLCAFACICVCAFACVFVCAHERVSNVYITLHITGCSRYDNMSDIAEKIISSVEEGNYEATEDLLIEYVHHFLLHMV